MVSQVGVLSTQWQKKKSAPMFEIMVVVLTPHIVMGPKKCAWHSIWINGHELTRDMCAAHISHTDHKLMITNRNITHMKTHEGLQSSVM